MAPQDALTDSTLEEVLVRHERAVDSALKPVNQLSSAVKAWKRATAAGDLSERAKQVAKACALASEVLGPIEAAAESWTFDAHSYLGGRKWRQELLDAARAAGHRLFEEGEDVISSPVVVKADPRQLALRVGKQKWPRLRPSLIVAELKRLRDRGEKEKGAQEILESLYATTKRLEAIGASGVGGGKQRQLGGMEGPIHAKLRDIYGIFALAPGWKRENSEASFAQSLYALHRSDARVTRDGKRYEWEFPTGQPAAKDIFSVIEESGRRIDYYMIHFA